MGRVARAAATVAVPEARVARKITPGMSHTEVNDELQARRAAAQQAKTAKAGATAPAPPPAPESPAPTSSGAGLSLPSLPAPASAAASTGSGFLLGVFAWAVGLAYLHGGTPGVRKFLAAKFLNKTS